MKEKKPKKLTNRKLQDLLWAECKRIIRAKYLTPNNNWFCFTCNRLINEPQKAQTGHFIPSSICGAYLRYDLRNLRIQCYNCNINNGGMGASYYRNLVTEEGQPYVDQLFQDKHKIIKAYDYWLELLEKYKLL